MYQNMRGFIEKKKPVILVMFVVVGVFVAFGYYVYSKANKCDEECTFIYDRYLESKKTDAFSVVTSQKVELGLVYIATGYVMEYKKDENKLAIVIRHSSLPSSTGVDLDDVTLEFDLSDESKFDIEGLGYIPAGLSSMGQIRTLEIEYRLAEVDFWRNVMNIWAKFRSSGEVDYTGRSELVEIRLMLVTDADQPLDPASFLESKGYIGVAEAIRNSVESELDYSIGERDSFEKLVISTRETDCHFGTKTCKNLAEQAWSRDLLFFSFLDSILYENGQGDKYMRSRNSLIESLYYAYSTDDANSDGLIGRDEDGLFHKLSTDYDEILSRKDGDVAVDRANNRGNESYCLPYFIFKYTIGESAGYEETLDLMNRTCVDSYLPLDGAPVLECGSCVQETIGDEDFFKWAERTIADADVSLKDDLGEGYEATSQFSMLTSDMYIVGYEKNNLELVDLGNQYVLRNIEYMKTACQESHWAPYRVTQSYLDIVRALLIKKYYLDGSEFADETECMLESFLSMCSSVDIVKSYELAEDEGEIEGAYKESISMDITDRIQLYMLDPAYWGNSIDVFDAVDNELSGTLEISGDLGKDKVFVTRLVEEDDCVIKRYEFAHNMSDALYLAILGVYEGQN